MAEPNKPRPWAYVAVAGGAVALVAMILIDLGGSGTEAAPGTDPTENARDASAQVACERWGRAARDFGDGVMTMDEFRTAIQRVDESADASRDPIIRTAGRDLLRAVTTGTTDDLIAAMDAMTAVCVE